MKISATRLYGLSDARYKSAAWGGVLFLSFGLVLLPALFIYTFITFAREWGWGHYAFVAALIAASLFVCGGLGLVGWMSIPPRIQILNPDHAEAFFSKRRFFLILWSFGDYDDLVGTKRVFNKWASGPVSLEISLDSKMCETAAGLGLQTMKLWKTSVKPPVGERTKSVLIECDDRIWQDVVRIAVEHATGVITFPGKGKGLDWEVGLIKSDPSLERKAVFLDKRLPDDLEETLRSIAHATHG